jgi:hypothetical protein
LSAAAAFGIACTATLPLSPLSWGHHYLLWLPGVVFLPAWLMERGRTRWGRWVAWTPAVLTVLHYSMIEEAGRVGLLGIGCAAWLFCACLLTVGAAPEE